MTVETDELWSYIDIIRGDSPETSDERIRYVGNVNKCVKVINELHYTDNDYILPLLEKYYYKYQELIIGNQYSKSVNSSQCAKIKEAYNNKCAVCGFPVANILEVHHIIPKALCGKNEDSNLVALCPTCHVIFHDIEQKGVIADELKTYLEEHNQIDIVTEYTKHLLIKT